LSLNFYEVEILALKKKTIKLSPKFCNCSSFGLQGKKKKKRGTSLKVPHQRRPGQN